MARERLQRWLRAGPGVLLALALALLAGALLAAPDLLWPWRFRAFLRIPWPAVAAVAAVAAAAALWPRRAPARAFPAFAALAFGALYAVLRVEGLGDGDTWAARAALPEVPASEPLGSLLLHLAARAGPGPGWVPPLAGALAAGAWFHALEALGEDGRPPSPGDRVLAVLLWAGSGVHAAFCRGFVENTPAAAAPLLAGIAVLAPWVRGAPGASGLRLLAGTGLFGLAAAVHGVATFFLPAPFLAVALRHLATGDGRQARFDLGVAATGLALAAGLALGILALAGVSVGPGNTGGGGDGLAFVPWRDQPTPFLEFTMLSAGHLLQVANGAFAAFPLLPVAVLALARGTAPGAPRPGPADARALAALCALAALAFLSLWNFDLGWPADLDLVQVPLVALSLALAARVRDAGPQSPAARLALGVVAAACGMLQLGLLAR